MLGLFIPTLQGIAGPGTGLINSVIGIINGLLTLAAIGGIAFVIIAGVRYFSSQGDEQAVSQAKRALIFGVIGIVLIILAAVIVNFFTAQIN